MQLPSLKHRQFWIACLFALSACSTTPEDGVNKNGNTQYAPKPLWTAKVAGDVVSKAFYPTEGLTIDDYELRHVEEPVEVYGFNEWWVMISSSADVFLPRSMIKDLSPDLSAQEPPPMFTSLSRTDHAACPIQTVDQNGMFSVIGWLPPNTPIGVYAMGPAYTQISPWLHWVSSSCLVNAPVDNPQATQEEVAGFMRSFRKGDGSWNGSVICYLNGNKVYLGYREPGATSATVPYAGPRDGTECSWADQATLLEGPKPRRRMCQTFGACKDAGQYETPFTNLAEMMVLQALLSIGGQPIQEIEFGPTGGGRFIYGFLGATGEQINEASHSQAVDMVFAFTSYMAAVHPAPSSGLGAIVPVATAVPGVVSLSALPDDTIVGVAGRPDLRLGLRPRDHLPIGDVTTPGKSGTMLNTFDIGELLRKFFGKDRIAGEGDAIHAAFVGDIRQAGYDVVPAPTVSNPSHVRIIPQPGVSFEEPTFLEKLMNAFTIVSRYSPSN